MNPFISVGRIPSVRWLILLWMSLIFWGCASSTKQSDALLASSTYPFKKSAFVERVPFIRQESGQCGPATLAMAMNWAGKNIKVSEIAPLVYTPGAKGSFQVDMITAARRQGLLAIPISGMTELFTEIHAGHPVIVFENLALRWLPQWHYALVLGYDLQNETVLMHSGPEQNKKWNLRKFERSWKLGDYWGLVVLPPKELSATASEIEHAKAAVLFEQMGQKKEASLVYQAMLKRWPKSLSALIGLGNLEFERNNFLKSVQYLRIATKAHPDSASAWHNLAIAESAAKIEGDEFF